MLDWIGFAVYIITLILIGGIYANVSRHLKKQKLAKKYKDGSFTLILDRRMMEPIVRYAEQYRTEDEQSKAIIGLMLTGWHFVDMVDNKHMDILVSDDGVITGKLEISKPEKMST